MKFKVTLDLDIWNQEFLDMINDNREWDDLAPYSSIEEIPEHEIQEFIENSDQYVKSVMFMNLFLKELDIKFDK
jgi:hypothetical protein